MTDCSRYAEWISLMHSGALSDDRRRDLDDHLSRCPLCRAELTLQEKIGEAIAGEPPPPFSAGFTRRVTALAVERRAAAKRSPAWLKLMPAAAITLAAVALFLLGTHLAPRLAPTQETVTAALSTPFSRTGETVIGFGASLLRTVRIHLPLLPDLPRLDGETFFIRSMIALLLVWSSFRVYSYLRE